MASVTTYENPASGDLIIRVTIPKIDVMGLDFNEPELEKLRKLENGEFTAAEMLEAIALLVRKIEERNK